MYQTKKFEQKKDAYNQLSKKLKEIYGITIEKNDNVFYNLKKSSISIKKRHALFAANRRCVVWILNLGSLLSTQDNNELKNKVALCNCSNGNVEIFSLEEFCAK